MSAKGKPLSRRKIMNRQLKALGLALVAFVALSAVVAQGALAEEFFHTHAKHVVITGEQHPQFPQQRTIFNNNAGDKKGELTCKKLHLTGDEEGVETPGTGTWTSTTLTVHPVYEECEITTPFKSAATVNTGKCHYRTTSNTEVTTKEPVEQKHARVRITCPKGENIRIETPSTGCVITINNEENPVGSGEFGQTTTHGVVYTNVNTSATKETNKKEITAHDTWKGIKYTSNFTCQLAGIPASSEKAEYEGTRTTRVFKYVSGTTEGNNYVTGEQVGIEKF
jgi:hypothetical protein